MSKLFSLLTISGFVLAACTGGGGRDTITGTRADGLTVVCEPTSTGGGDDAYECTPSDGDDRCEGFDDGGAAIVLWPPNHKLVTVALADCAALPDDCPIETAPSAAPGAAPGVAIDAHITAITADEAVDAKGDGSTKDYDMRIVDDATIEVRSERQGGGDGRVYRVHYETGDGVAGSCEIHVPHDQGPVGGAVDSGEAARVEL
jgi:hypothetical protein